MTVFNLASGFDAKNLRAKLISPDRAIAHYSNSFRGKTYVHVREIWRDTGTNLWSPGKGIACVEVESKAYLAAIREVTEPAKPVPFKPESTLIPARKVKVVA